ncbi:hypothetical protein PFLUV_G00155130 [Perca fluviatilis]|uniref:Uncharacterized protein n=1 Tax=Perca fluviatilis TaxID=8168 RepID=A0A6A5ER17_PERFL|nr:hypothetical protein PFLUV_G00155130 [Perca fluviatilis]
MGKDNPNVDTDCSGVCGVCVEGVFTPFTLHTDLDRPRHTPQSGQLFTKLFTDGRGGSSQVRCQVVKAVVRVHDILFAKLINPGGSLCACVNYSKSRAFRAGVKESHLKTGIAYLTQHVSSPTEAPKLQDTDK